MADRVAGRRRARLDVPATSRRTPIRPQYDPEAFGRFAEAIARFLGTSRFIVMQTIVVIIWITLNLAAVELRWDPYPFILLNLAFSTQAAYAAPLILLAQNRQADRDRVLLDEDRARAERAAADTEYLTREIAALRQALGEVATRDYLRDQLRESGEEVVATLVARVPGAATADDERRARKERKDREERERRAERKKRRAELATDQDRPDERPDLGEPFVGEVSEI